MTSHLRLQASFTPFEAVAVHQQTSPTLPPAKKQKMSISRTYAVASAARSKLGREASRADHNLRRLVGHANLLDTLMVELADAEREQEAWFNHSVRKAGSPEEPRHIQWVDSITQEIMEDDDSDSDADSDIYDEDDESLYSMSIPKLNTRQPAVIIESTEIEADDQEDYDEDDDEHHALIRVPSKHSPPELLIDDSDSDDESTPSSPEAPTLELSEKERQAISDVSFFAPKAGASIEDYIMQDRQTPLIATY